MSSRSSNFVAGGVEMRSAMPLVVFPILIDRLRPAPSPSHAGVSGVSYTYDPRRLDAETLSRTRRCPPPVEDDSAETLWYLAWCLLFTYCAWQFG